MSFANDCPAVHSEGGLLSKDDKEHGDVDHDDDFDDDDGGDDVNVENYDGGVRQSKRMASTMAMAFNDGSDEFGDLQKDDAAHDGVKEVSIQGAED